MDDADLDDVDLVWLQRSYTRRIRYEARVQAAEIARMFGGETGTGTKDSALIPGTNAQSNSGKTYRVATADALMAHAGVVMDGR